jgi:site-specific recombinase XerD
VTVFLTGYTSANSRRAMTSSLCAVGSLLSGRSITDPRAVPWHELRYEHVNAAKAKMATMYASTSVNRHLTAIRGVIKACWRVGLIDREVYDRVADVPLMRASRPEAGRALSEEEVIALFDSCNNPPDERVRNLYVRDAAILALTLGCGLRRAEVCELLATSYDPKLGCLHVHGKGDKYRIVYLPPKSKDRLDAWMKVRTDKPGHLICPCSTEGRPMIGKPLAHQGLTHVLEQICLRSKIAGFTPHDLRRTFITRLLDKGADPLIVSKLAGHATVQTTLKYDRRGEKAKQEAVTLLDF